MKSLPTTAVFNAVDSDLLATSRAHIFREFEELLLRGKQVESLPDDVMAAGQYLIPFEINQRGLYGTAAAISVVTHSDSSAKADLLTRLIRYLSRRTDVENVIATSTSDWAMLAGRLERGCLHLKNADVLSALANVSTLITLGVTRRY